MLGNMNISRNETYVEGIGAWFMHITCNVAKPSIYSGHRQKEIVLEIMIRFFVDYSIAV